MDETNAEIASFFNGREEVEKQATELASQRGGKMGALASKKYYDYIMNHLEKIKEVFDKLENTRGKLENIRGKL